MITMDYLNGKWDNGNIVIDATNFKVTAYGTTYDTLTLAELEHHVNTSPTSKISLEASVKEFFNNID